MSTERLILEDSCGRRLHFGKWANQIYVIPIVEKIGDAITIDDRQAHLLYLYLKERFEP